MAFASKCDEILRYGRTVRLATDEREAVTSEREAASLDLYLPKNTSNCGTYSEPDPRTEREKTQDFEFTRRPKCDEILRYGRYGWRLTSERP